MVPTFIEFADAKALPTDKQKDVYYEFSMNSICCVALTGYIEGNRNSMDLHVLIFCWMVNTLPG
jgi:hypothetical protein